MTQFEDRPDHPEGPAEHGDEPRDGGLDDLDLGHEDAPRGRGAFGCIFMLLVVALVLFGLYLGLNKGIDWVKDQFADPEDYAGPGAGAVTVEVVDGDTATDIGRTLEEADVVASVEAFTDAASERQSEASGIQVGFYKMKKQMAAEDALEILIDPANRVSSRITIPEGLRVVDTVKILAKETDFSAQRFRKALDQPGKLGLPDYAKGNAEGYLFPATYDFGPKAKPVDMLKAMVDRWRQAAEQANLVKGAEKLGYTPHEIMTIAALVEAEGRGDDMPKIARVIYNRLENPGTAGTTGRLEIDATVNYALGRNLGVAITTEEIDSVADNPYNTRRQDGLPPGPIEAPGDDALQAALNPAQGDWYYYVTVNLKTGKTKFAESYDEFLQYKNELREYCTTSDAC